MAKHDRAARTLEVLCRMFYIRSCIELWEAMQEAVREESCFRGEKVVEAMRLLFAIKTIEGN
jgi:hypothetical protein